jgi:drug/metabolite transporter (DMT)-like permease
MVATPVSRLGGYLITGNDLLLKSLNLSVRALFEALFAVIVWGASFIATKVALREVSPITVIWLRFGIGVIVLGLLVINRRQFGLPKAKDLGYFTLLGFSGVTFHQWLQSNGLVTAQASTTAWIVSTTPVFMALLGWLILKEGLGWLRAAGIAIAAMGVLIVVSHGDWSSISAGHFLRMGDVLIMISAPNWAVFSVLSRRGLQQNPPARMMFFVMGVGWLLLSLLLLTGPGLSEIGRLQWDGWLAIGFLGVFCSGLAYVFWYDALQEIPAGQLGVFLYLEPLVTVVVAAILLNEAIFLSSLLGGFLILFGVWIVQMKVKRQPVVELPGRIQ